VNLAVFRVAVGALLLLTHEVWTAAAWASLPASLAVTPRGWGWALSVIPPNLTLARGAQIVLTVAAILGTLGCFTRVAFAAVVIAALYLLALPLRSGLPYHYQHLVWFAALCASSPCGDALSIDAWRRRSVGAGPGARSIAYGIPIRVAWLLLGAVFFFPGIWKLRAAGLGWITSDNLRNQLYWKWAVTPGLVPPFRIDHFPRLLHVGAAGVVLLELTFGLAVWRRSLRIVAVVAALIFHAFARLFMGIDFSALWLTYVVFIDWDRICRRWRLRRGDDKPSPVDAAVTISRLAPVIVVGIVLVAGAVEAGVRGVTNGWPFACYPTFQERAGAIMPALIVSIVGPDGHEDRVDLSANAAPADLPRERMFGLRLIAQASAPDAPARFAAYWQRVSPRASLPIRRSDIRAVRFYAGQISTPPEDRRRPPQRVRLLYELAPDAPSTMMPRARSGAITSPSSDEAARVK
jgi:vitamin K-dependent gamma-carboxylase-like protein